MVNPKYAGATGILAAYVPEGDDRDELLGLVRLGIKFKTRQSGRHEGPLARLVLNCVERSQPKTFKRLLFELDAEASKRESEGSQASIVEKVDRIFEIITLHIPGQGRTQRTFSALEWHFSRAKNKLNN